jgi:Putative DNA-binding domain
MDREQVLLILDGGDFAPLLGVREDLEVEFKRQPYRLDAEGERFELAKDVCAMANAAGGVIVIGVQTERREESPLDEAVRIRAFERGLVDEERYVAIVTERVYPRIQGLRVEFKAQPAGGGGEAQRGLVLIDVPPQAEGDKLFLVQRPVSQGTATPGWLVGVAVRSVGRVDERRVGEIHALINRGYTLSSRIEELHGEVGAIRERLDAEPAAPVETPADRLPQALADWLAELEAPIEEDR